MGGITAYFLCLLSLTLISPRGLPTHPRVSGKGSPKDWTWEHVGPQGGGILFISQQPEDPNKVYASGIFRGWVSMDGQSWEVLPFFATRRLLATGQDRVVLLGEDSLYFSTDGGVSWTPVLPLYGDFVAVTEKEDSVLFVVSSGSLYGSWNGGESWSLIAPFNYDALGLARSRTDTLIFYAAALVDSGYVILKSSDGGISWSEVHFVESIEPPDRELDVEINPIDPDEVLLSIGLGGKGRPCLYTSDGGATWEYLSSFPLADVYMLGDVDFVSPDTILAASQFKQGILRGVRQGGGFAFELLDSSFATNSLSPGEDRIYAGTSGGVLFSENGEDFSLMNTGLSSIFMWVPGQWTLNLDGRVFMSQIATDNFLYRTLDGGQTWDKVKDDEWAVVVTADINPANPDRIYASGIGAIPVTESTFIFHDLYISDDNGNSWTSLTTRDHPDSLWPFFWLRYSTIPQAHFLGLDQDVLYLSDDDGETWDTLITDVENVVGRDTVFLSLGDSGDILFSLDGGYSFDTLVHGADAQLMVYSSDLQTLFYISSIDSFYWVDVEGNKGVEALGYFIFPTGLEAGPGGALYVGGLDMLAGINLFGRRAWPGPWEWDTLDFFPALIRASGEEILLGSMGTGIFRSTDAVIGIRERVSQEGKTGGPQLFFRGNILVLNPSLLGGESPFLFKLIDPSGRVVLRRYLGHNQEEFLFTVNLASGVYLWKLMKQRKAYMGKVIKLE